MTNVDGLEEDWSDYIQRWFTMRQSKFQPFPPFAQAGSRALGGTQAVLSCERVFL